MGVADGTCGEHKGGHHNACELFVLIFYNDASTLAALMMQGRQGIRPWRSAVRSETSRQRITKQNQ
jgi:hypothetical protein